MMEPTKKLRCGKRVLTLEEARGVVDEWAKLAADCDDPDKVEEERQIIHGWMGSENE